jgi:transcription elongation factor GreB
VVILALVSKAFTKEDVVDQPVVVPSRAPLPAGVVNYVTSRGLALLREESATLEKERAELEQVFDAEERARRLAIVAARLGELAGRIGSAVVVDPGGGATDQVRFGATVTVRALEGAHAGQDRRYTIVGVDEASAADGRIAFVSPLARAVLGRRVGESVSMVSGRREEELEIVAVEYAPAR